MDELSYSVAILHYRNFTINYIYYGYHIYHNTNSFSIYFFIKTELKGTNLPQIQIIRRKLEELELFLQRYTTSNRVTI